MEGALIVAAIAITGGGSAIWYGLNRRKKWRDNLVRVAAAYGLDFTPGGFIGRAKVEGQIDGADVCIESESTENNTNQSHIRAKKNISERLIIRREGSLASVTKLFTGEDVQVRIPFFDNTIFLDGQDSQILAFLDSKTRDLVLMRLRKASSFWMEPHNGLSMAWSPITPNLMTCSN